MSLNKVSVKAGQNPVIKLTAERDILKKAAAYFAQEAR